MKSRFDYIKPEQLGSRFILFVTLTCKAHEIRQSLAFSQLYLLIL